MSVLSPDLFWALMQAEKQRYIADRVEQAELDAADEGRTLRYTENGMCDPTPYGQRLENDAAQNADHMFDRIVALYVAEAAKFDPNGPYNDVVEHVGNEFKHAVSEDENDILERIGEAYFKQLQQQALPPSAQEQICEAARILLNTPLEFADIDSEGLLTCQEQKQLSGIVKKLRWLDKLNPAQGKIGSLL